MRYSFLILLCIFINSARSQCKSGYCLEKRPSICPNIIERHKWGASKATDVNYAIIPVEYVVIHHTATENCTTKEDCINIVKSIQSFHLDELDFGDIGYNFLIGGDGNVYEGVGWHRIGAHTYGVNSRSIGIAFIGNFMRIDPTEEQKNVAKNLLECAVELKELDKDYKLYGGRQIISTSSPGLKLYKEIKTWPHWSPELPPKIIY